MVDNQNGHRYCKKNMKTSGQKMWSEEVVRKGGQKRCPGNGNTALKVYV